MDSSENEFFWNSSSFSQHNFFDDDDDEEEISSPEADVFSTVAQKNAILPIHMIISNKSLKLLIEDVTMVQCLVETPKKAIRRMFIGDKCVLEVFQSLEDKLQLLDEAIAIADGNIIVTVILFLKQTLNNNIFFTHLSRRQVAVKHYANYLIEINNLQQLADLYMATGKMTSLKDIYYSITKDTSSQSALYKKIQQFNICHAQNISKDQLEIQDHLSFLEFQINHKLSATSVVDLLETVFKLDLDKGNNNSEALKKQFKLDDFQYEWVLMNVLCRTKNWQKLELTFHKTMWMMKKHVLKSVIKPSLFVTVLHRYNPPEEVLHLFLSCIGNSSESLKLAEKLRIISYIVDYHVGK